MKIKWSIMATGTVDVSRDELEDCCNSMPGYDLTATIVELIEDDVMSSGLDVRIDNFEEVEAELKEPTS